MSYVSPTKEMAIRPGQHISGEGRIYHPYLVGWRDDRSNLVEFISLLQDIFAREPPVVAKDRQPERPIYIPHDGGVPPPVPPLPPELGGIDNRRQFQGRENPPLPPPKPFEGHVELSSKYDKPPPLPPIPQPSTSRHGTHLHQANGHIPSPLASVHHVARGTSNASQQYMDTLEPRHPFHQQTHWQPPREPRRSVSPTNAPSQPALSQPNVQYIQRPPYQQQHPQPTSRARFDPPQAGQPMFYNDPRSQGTQAPRQQQQQKQQQQQQQTQRHPPTTSQPSKPKPPEDLLTSPFETALPVQSNNTAPPPIPPNPQKDALLSALSHTLTQQMQATHTSNMSAIAPLRAQQAALTSTLNAVNREISQLNDLEAMLSSNEAILHQAMRDADKTLEDAKRRKVPNVDDVLVAPTVVAGQLYQAVAGEKAIEDCRGVLGKALDKGRIGGVVWAKQTRSLAREEFLKKTLIKKISRGMGLAEEGRWH
ncbi:MAG: hypothetical protein Q9164_003734 [Protoblastenia rupestris]